MFVYVMLTEDYAPLYIYFSHQITSVGDVFTWIPTKTQAKSIGGEKCGRDKFGFVSTGTHNEAMIK